MSYDWRARSQPKYERLKPTHRADQRPYNGRIGRWNYHSWHAIKKAATKAAEEASRRKR